MSRTACLVIAAALLVGCSSDAPGPTAPISVPVFSDAALHSPNAIGGNFGAPLSAAEEVMPPGVENDSRARGNALFQLNRDRTELSYQLSVANIENVVAAHIHQGPAGVNGPVTVWLYPSTSPPGAAPGGGRLDGVIARGTITAANLTGPLTGGTLEDLLDDLTSGNAYVNVHTRALDTPGDTGPGDFPGGEIRGQIRHRGH